jgi:hypothetical protein
MNKTCNSRLGKKNLTLIPILVRTTRKIAQSQEKSSIKPHQQKVPAAAVRQEGKEELHHPP